MGREVFPTAAQVAFRADFMVYFSCYTANTGRRLQKNPLILLKRGDYHSSMREERAPCMS